MARFDGMQALIILLQIVSIFVGAAITYVMNVRQRRRTYEEDLVNAAIAAVAAAEISVDYIASVGQPAYRRLRVGDWRGRFAFDDEHRVIVVLGVLPRGRAYDR